jgi:hypothetical protein
MAVWHNDREELYLLQSDVPEMMHISLSVSARIREEVRGPPQSTHSQSGMPEQEWRVV